MFGHDDQKDENDVTTINPTLGSDSSTTPIEDPSVATDSTASPAPDDTVANEPAEITVSAPVTNTDADTDDIDVTPVEPSAPVVSPDSNVADTTQDLTTNEEPTVSPAAAATPLDDTTASTDSSTSSGTSTDDTTTDLPDFSAPSTSTASPTAGEDEDLLDLKKEALEELAPLIDQLDQNPEEKFKTTMMMIQATDDSNLVKLAHQAAQQIDNEKIRAQALLDIVNEINYFTQKDAIKN